jgi:hypothetical protein
MVITIRGKETIVTVSSLNLRNTPELTQVVARDTIFRFVGVTTRKVFAGPAAGMFDQPVKSVRTGWFSFVDLKKKQQTQA